MSDLPEPQFVRCERCGNDRSLHKAANLTDGAFVGEYLLICPTSVFKAEPIDTSALEDKAKSQARRTRDEG